MRLKMLVAAALLMTGCGGKPNPEPTAFPTVAPVAGCEVEAMSWPYRESSQLNADFLFSPECGTNVTHCLVRISGSVDRREGDGVKKVDISTLSEALRRGERSCQVHTSTANWQSQDWPRLNVQLGLRIKVNDVVTDTFPPLHRYHAPSKGITCAAIGPCVG